MKVPQFSIIISYITMFSLYFQNTQAQTYNWSQLNDFGGTARFGSFSFVIGNYGYIGGGYANGSNMSDMWQFNPANNSWTQKSNCPLALRASGNFSANGKGYVVCGLAGSSTIVDNVFAYDPVSNTWTAKADYPGTPVYGAMGFEINNKGYFGIGNGGSANGPYYTAFYEYNPVNDTWSQKMAFPGTPRYGTFGLGINGKGYVGFGGDDGPNIYFSDWYQYDPGNNSWTQKAYFTGSGRSYTTGFAINNTGFICCGSTSPTTQSNSFYKYDPVSDAWTQLQNFTGGSRWIASGFAIGDTGYVGIGNDGINYLRDFWKYAPDSSTSINEIALSDISVYPNPCTNIVTIQNNQIALFKSVEIVTADGNILYSNQKHNGISKLHQIDLTTLPAGVYFIKMNYENRSIVKKIFKI